MAVTLRYGTLLLAGVLHLRRPRCCLGADEAQAFRGNPLCWSGNFTFEVCCRSEEFGRRSGCWSLHFSYELCCLPPFAPSKLCAGSRGAEELLWHCRARPHRELERCYRSGPGLGEQQGKLLGPMVGDDGARRFSYDTYVATQRAKAETELDKRFFSERALQVVGAYLRRHFRDRTQLRGLCHGAKVGEEVRSVRAELRRHSGGGVEAANFTGGVEVYGTDISEQASRASNGDVMLLDFHLVYMEWEDHWDFVYSNALDHSYQPIAALLAWRWTLAGKDALVVLHRSPLHSSMTIDTTDLYGGSIGDYCSLLRTARFEVLDVVRLPGDGGFFEEDLVFAVRGTAPHLSRTSEVPEGRAHPGVHA